MKQFDINQFKRDLARKLEERNAQLQARLDAMKAEERKQRLNAEGYSELSDNP